MKSTAPVLLLFRLLAVVFNVALGKYRLFHRKFQSILKSVCRQRDFSAKTLWQKWHADIKLNVYPEEGRNDYF